MRLIINGASGHMGKMLIKNLNNKHKLFLFDKENPLEEGFLQKNDIDGIIDFTNGKELVRILNLAIKFRIFVISGSTGYDREIIQVFDKKAKEAKIGIYLISNFSLNYYHLIKALDKIKDGYEDIIIEETHHISKLDSPSGTALKIKEALQPKNVTIISKRVNQEIFSHDIIFIGPYESLKIEHKILSRDVYFEGVLLALDTINSFVGIRTSLDGVINNT